MSGDLDARPSAFFLLPVSSRLASPVDGTPNNASDTDWVENAPRWRPPIAAAPGPDSWHPDDMLLSPLRAFTGEILGVVSVDEPLSSQQPRDTEPTILMAVADHAGRRRASYQPQRRRSKTDTHDPPQRSVKR
jgi:hypothetical protein